MKKFISISIVVVLKKTDCFKDKEELVVGGLVLGDSLGSLRDSVLDEITTKGELDCSLDLTGGDGGPLVDLGKTASLGSDPLKQVVGHGVEDAHGLGMDTNVGVDLLQNPLDVDGVGLLPLPSLLLLSLGGGVSNSAEFLSRNLGWHDEMMLRRLALVNCVKVAGVSWYLYSSGT